MKWRLSFRKSRNSKDGRRRMNAVKLAKPSGQRSLFNRLYEHFGALIADVGGLYNPALIAGLVRAADETWLVADQSIGALVSLAEMAQDLKRLDVPLQRVSLVLNRYDDRYGMGARSEEHTSDLKSLMRTPYA